MKFSSYQTSKLPTSRRFPLGVMKAMGDKNFRRFYKRWQLIGTWKQKHTYGLLGVSTHKVSVDLRYRVNVRY